MIARSLTAAYKNEEIEVGSLARKVNADYVLEGGIRRSGDELRVTARLFDTQAGTNIWAESFDVTLDSTSLFEIQDWTRARPRPAGPIS